MENYKEVPNIISCKDLDYLCDMFNWNYQAYKNTYNNMENIKDEEIKEMMEDATSLFNSNMEQILDILGGNYE